MSYGLANPTVVDSVESVGAEADMSGWEVGASCLVPKA